MTDVCVCVVFFAAMFSLFICITQDGWLRISNALISCGNSVPGTLYLIVFIIIGAFILANLVVAVLVTNLVSRERRCERREERGRVVRKRREGGDRW